MRLAFGLPFQTPDVKKQIKTADARMLATKNRDLMLPTFRAWASIDGFPPYAQVILPWSPERVRDRFLQTYTRLLA